MHTLKFGNFFMVIPLIVYVFLIKSKRFLKHNLTHNMSLCIAFFELILLSLVKYNETVFLFYLKFQYSIYTIDIFVFLISKFVTENHHSEDKNKKKEPENLALFNILYVNTSKVHEIVMLIDNKIMKTVEKEQISEELLKTSYSIGVQSNGISTDKNVQSEDNSKKRVYESFDVKTTKSIMLRKLYDVVNKKAKNQDSSLKTGQLIMFKEVELERRNLDDTVMILNVLQDSKIKNQGDDNIEINMNKMMEKMLDDFTIDYVFERTSNNGDLIEKYIFQLPYKSNANFENGYQHNDLQLGSVSIIGIYRGNIDFSGRESVSSKFLEIMSDSYNNTTNNVGDDIMRTSIAQASHDIMPFEFNHNKLEGCYHVIDIIAIIQELNINEEN